MSSVRDDQDEIDLIRSVRQGMWMQLMKDPDETLKLLEKCGLDTENLPRDVVLGMMMKELASKGLEAVERSGSEVQEEEYTFLSALI